MCRRFSLEWSFVSSRNSLKISCNRVSRKLSFVGASIGKTSYITCGCSWCVRFNDIEHNKCSNTDSVVITAVCGFHSNTCDPSYVDQFVLVRTGSGNYKKCADQCLNEVMVQIAIESFVSIRVIKELLSKVMPERKHIDKNIINNVRIRARNKRLELENADIDILTLHL